MAQIDKNTVSAKGQLAPTQFVTFFGNPNAALRVMYVGNSITRHSPAPGIGWSLDCGMAASSPDADYVHLLSEKVLSRRDAFFCICQVAEWERLYRNEKETYSLFRAAREFGADVIVFRLIENCGGRDFDSTVFRRSFSGLIDYLVGEGKPRVLMTSSFWAHPGDPDMKEIAEERGYPYVYLTDLGEKDEMKAIGLFAHEGVANHPGDLGMRTIAERIWEKLGEMV